MRAVCLILLLGQSLLTVASGAETNSFLPAMPKGYFLQDYDDCGVADRQPHVVMKDCYLWTFNTSDTKASLKERSSVFSPKDIRAVYTNLNPNLSYVLALTYANDHVYHRVQSLEAGDGVVLHGPYELPKGKATRIMVKVPTEAIHDGRLVLIWKLHGEANVTVSIIELWANAPAADSLQFDALVGLPDRLHGQLFDKTFDGVSNATVSLSVPGQMDVLTTKTGPGGAFSVSRTAVETLATGKPAILAASLGEQQGHVPLETTNLFFDAVKYRPLPEKTAGLAVNSISLNGTWSINPSFANDTRARPLSDRGWATFKVPGQWLPQGFDIPKDHTAAVAKEFVIPKEWNGYRIFLRFDAIHGGSHYWLNGTPLGYSENLFTPVEWEITSESHPGQTNRLDLQMTVATTSEHLSYSSDYTGHSLGGIDRAVRIYALPKLQISHLRLDAGLDAAYRDGELQIDLTLDNPGAIVRTNVEVFLRIYNSEGKEIKQSVPKTKLGTVNAGSNEFHIQSRVANPLKWNAEEPNLYRLAIELFENGKMLERVERNIGFRKIEIKGRQLYVNGARVKLAGVCHHEIDPLTGRADTMRHAEEDVKLFKSANLNDVRTSHYPPTEEFLDAADRYGMYVESEAPFCWVAPETDLADVKAVLTATSAMIDYNQAHPSVIVWSLANESHWSELFEESQKLCKQLDRTRPTTFNLAFTRENEVTCDIMNRHYERMPYDQILKDDPRPYMNGECFFEVYHERTDVAIDPGLRKLWSHGNADPASSWSKSCVENLTGHEGLYPGIFPDAWNSIYRSDRVIGSEIWAGVDDILYLRDGSVSSSENGNAYWGLIDGWRRPKPELELSKFVFSPVWFPIRQLDYKAGQCSVRVPVENRYSFTDLSQLNFIWELNGAKGKSHLKSAPGSKGEIEIPVPKGTPAGTTLFLRAVHGGSEIVNATLSLGLRPPYTLPEPQSGAPQWNDDGKLITIDGNGFSLVLDRTTGNFDPANPRHKAALITFPSLHVTRHDFGDLKSKKAPFEEFPDAKTRVVESVTATETGHGLELTVKDHYKDFVGAIRWLMDKDGAGRISYDYTYTGDPLDSREIGIKVLLPAEYDEIKWRSWSEWGKFSQDSICRTEGTAKAHRDKKWPAQPANVKPAWPWSQDETDLGTADFRSIKFNIYEASLVAPNLSGVEVQANADADVRACLSKDGVMLHILKQCPLAEVVLHHGDRLAGTFAVRLLKNP
jgi:hypothetical protein